MTGLADIVGGLGASPGLIIRPGLGGPLGLDQTLGPSLLSYTTVTSATFANSLSAISHKSGRVYFEVLVTNASNSAKNQGIGIFPTSLSDAANGLAVSPNWAVDLQGDVFINGAYIGTVNGTASVAIWRIAADFILSKTYYQVQIGGVVQGNGWDNSATDNPATGTGGYGITSGQAWLAGIAVDPANAGAGNATNGAFQVNLTGPFSAGLPAGFAPWGGNLNPANTSPQLSLQVL